MRATLPFKRPFLLLPDWSKRKGVVRILKQPTMREVHNVYDMTPPTEKVAINGDPNPDMT